MFTMDRWQDVDARRNVSMLLRACKEFEVPTATVWDALPRRLQDMSPAVMGGQMLTLMEYNVVQDAVASALGHPSHLINVGHCGATMPVPFGAETMKKFFATQVPVLNRLTSPWNGYAELGEGALLWNENKIWWTEREPGTTSSALLFATYGPGRYGKPRTAQQDRRSLYLLIRGMNEGFPTIWPGQGMGRVSYLMMPLPIRQYIRDEVGREVTIREGQLYLAGDSEAFGGVVWLQPDGDGIFRGRVSQEAQPRSIRAAQLTRDVETPCRRCTGVRHPIAFADDVFELDTPFPHAVLRVSWDPCFGDRVQQLLGLRSREVRHHLLAEHVIEAAGRRLVTAEQEARLAHAALAHNFPNMVTAMEVLEGRFGQDGVRQQVDIVLEADIVGSVQHGASRQPVTWATEKQRFLDAAGEKARAHGLWLYKRGGDAVMVVGTTAFGQVGEQKNTDMTEVMSQVLEFAIELLDLAHTILKVELRVGIAVGENIWNVHADRSKIDATGSPCVESTDLEGAGNPGAILMTHAAYRLVVGNRHRCADLGDTPTKKRGHIRVFQLLDERAKVLDLAEGRGRVRSEPA
jgi:class 3 adenylate cyclase